MLERIKHILIKEFIQIFRDPRMKAVLFVMPVVQTLIFSYSVTTDVRNIPTAIYDLDNSKDSRCMINEFTYSKYFEIKYLISNDEEQKDLIDHSIVNVVIRINKGFAKNMKGNGHPLVQLIIDGSDSNTAAVITSYANRIIENYTSRITEKRAKILLNRIHDFPMVDLKIRAWFNANLESRNFYIPGVIALIVTLITLLLTSMAIVREKEIGTIEQLIVSPIKSYELILGKLAPFGLIALGDAVFVTFVGVFFFDVPIRGNLFFLFSSTIIFLIATLGIGLLISTMSNTQQEAMMSTFFFYFPAMLLSGFMFPISNMPVLIQLFTYLNPLRYYLIILRGIFLKGIGIDVLWPQLFALSIMGIVILIFSSLRFKKNIG